jgi:hypothetical protein
LVTASVPEVEVSFAVSPLTWEERLLTPVVVNAPANIPFTLQPATVTVRYGYRQSNAAAITPEQFEAVLNFARLNPADSTAPVELSRKPVQVHRVLLQPAKIKLTPTAP